jgi:hypothetical protein
MLNFDSHEPIWNSNNFYSGLLIHKFRQYPFISFGDEHAGEHIQTIIIGNYFILCASSKELNAVRIV